MAGILGYMGGTAIDYGATRLLTDIYGRPMTIGEAWYEIINGPYQPIEFTPPQSCN